jgi:hypothetical protein
MATKLSRKGEQRLRRLSEGLEHISQLVNRVSLEEMSELLRRSEIRIDPSSISGGSVIQARTNSDPSSSPVERAVMARLDGRAMRDPLTELVREIEKLIIEAEGALAQAHRNIHLIKNPLEKTPVRKTPTPCDSCLIFPAVRTGFCVECYGEWVDAGSPDRQRWVAFKRQLTSSDGQVLVEHQPPPRPGIRNT